MNDEDRDEDLDELERETDDPDGLCRLRPRGGEPMKPGRLLGDLDRHQGSFHSSGLLVTESMSFLVGGSIGPLGGMFVGDRGLSVFSFSSFFSLGSRRGLSLGLPSFSSRFRRSLSHSSFLRRLSFSRSRSLSLSRSLCLRSRSRWSLSRSRSLSRCRSRGSRSRSRSG